MAEVLRVMEEPVRDDSGAYHARVVGRRGNDGRWEGWLEFLPERAGRLKPLATAIESRQPEREHLVYWASGLTAVYAEGALNRARHPTTVRTRAVEVARASGSPSEKPPAPVARDAPRRARAIIDPIEAGARNLDVLAQELGALDRGRLFDVIADYDLNPAREDLAWMTEAQLVRFITTAVESRLLQRK